MLMLFDSSTKNLLNINIQIWVQIFMKALTTIEKLKNELCSAIDYNSDSLQIYLLYFMCRYLSVYMYIT